LASTAISTNTNPFEPGNYLNNSSSPDSSGSLFNAATAFNNSENLNKPSTNKEEKPNPFARFGFGHKAKDENHEAVHHEAKPKKGFAYSLYESILKSWTNALLTSTPAEVIVNAITKEGDAQKLSNHLEKQLGNLKVKLETANLSVEEKEKLQAEIQELEKYKLDPNGIEYNAFNNNAAKTFSDSFLSRLITDIGVAQSIATFRRTFPDFAKRFPVVNTLIGDLVAKPLTFIVRTVTAENNILTNSANHAGEVSPEQKIIIEAMKDTGVGRAVRWIRGEDADGNKIKGKGFNLKGVLDPFINTINKYLLGIREGEILKDENGEPIYMTDANGKKEEIKALAKFNPIHFGITSLTSLILTATTLDKHAQATGFEDANTPVQALMSMVLANANRVDSAMGSYAHSSVRKGDSYLGIFNNIFSKKLLMPICQNFMKGMSNLLTGFPLNPVTKSIILNSAMEFTAPPFIQTFMPKAEKRAIDPAAQFVSHKLIKPPLEQLYGVLKPAWLWWGKHFHAAVGTYPAKIKLSPVSSPFWLIQKVGCFLTGSKPKDIPGLFKDPKETIFSEDTLEEVKKLAGGPVKTAAIAAKSIVTSPVNVGNWFVKSQEANKVYSNLTKGIQEAASISKQLTQSKQEIVATTA